MRLSGQGAVHLTGRSRMKYLRRPFFHGGKSIRRFSVLWVQVLESQKSNYRQNNCSFPADGDFLLMQNHCLYHPGNRQVTDIFHCAFVSLTLPDAVLFLPVFIWLYLWRTVHLLLLFLLLPAGVSVHHFSSFRLPFYIGQHTFRFLLIADFPGLYPCFLRHIKQQLCVHKPHAFGYRTLAARSIYFGKVSFPCSLFFLSLGNMVSSSLDNSSACFFIPEK